MPKSQEAARAIELSLLRDRPLPWADHDFLWVALHRSDPSATGRQSSNEVSYDGYARAGIKRSELRALDDGGVTNAIEVQFPEAHSDGDVPIYFSLGLERMGDGMIIYFDRLGPGKGGAARAILENDVPAFRPGALVFREF